MSYKSSTRYRLFSPALEDCINGSSKVDGSIPKSLLAKLTDEELEALTMWNYKQHDILPNMYHYSYNDGDTIIYLEHIRDLVIIDKMVSNKLRKDVEQERAREKQKQKNPLGASSRGIAQKQSGFYGHTFRFNNN